MPDDLKRRGALLFLAATWAWQSAAWADKPEITEADLLQPVAATLIVEHASVQPGGRTRLGVLFELEEGWHIYGRDPGDAGLPTTIAWKVPRGVTMSPLVWPPAQEFIDPGDIHTFGYNGTVLIASPLTASITTPLRPIPVAAEVRWLACKDICLPGSAHLTLSLPVAATEPVISTHALMFHHTGE